MDVSDINDIKRKIPAAMELFPRKIDILVNCAGVGVKHSFWDIDEKEYDDIMNTNTRGMFFVSQLVSKYMVDNHIHGHILNVSSSSGAIDQRGHRMKCRSGLSMDLQEDWRIH